MNCRDIEQLYLQLQVKLIIIIFSSFGLQTFINGEKAVFITDVKEFPFLSFKSLSLFYSAGVGPHTISIDMEIQLLQIQLQLFKTALSDLELLTLNARINQNDPNMFRDYSQLLDHFREQVLPICDSAPVYKLLIDFQTGSDRAADFIVQILQLPRINRCNCQEVSFFYLNETFIQLPVDAISHWLNRNFDNKIDGTGQGKKQRLLATNHHIRIQNAVEMYEHLKTVMVFHCFFEIVS